MIYLNVFIEMTPEDKNIDLYGDIFYNLIYS
jgi:hypothetical protein